MSGPHAHNLEPRSFWLGRKGTYGRDMDLPTVPLDSFDLSDVEGFWAGRRDVREGAFKTLRDRSGLVRYDEPEIEGSPFPTGPGYWALARHEDVWSVSRNPELFCSGLGSNIGDLPPEMNEFFGSMIGMDDPRHYRLRSIVSKGFTPKEICTALNYLSSLAGEDPWTPLSEEDCTPTDL